jgi:hypothetical protein
MWYCPAMDMSMTVLAFLAMASASVVFGAATVARELNFQLPALTQTGDSSLRPQSVNWLGGTALLAAVLICFVLR